MVVGDTQGKPQERRGGSVTPTRSRGRGKPRQDWLVALGQGHSPASTRRRESKSSATRKKIDVDSLSFSGLERQDRTTPRQSQSPGRPRARQRSPPASPSRPKKTPGVPSSPARNENIPASSTAATAFQTPDRSRETASGASTPPGPKTPQTDDTTAGLLGSPVSVSRLSFSATEPQDSPGPAAAWTPASTDGDAAAAAGDGKLTLASLLLSSPGKDYWAGRIAQSPRGPASPRRSARAAKGATGTLGVSPASRRPAWQSLSPAREQQKPRLNLSSAFSPRRRRAAAALPESPLRSAKASVSPGGPASSFSGEFIGVSPAARGGFGSSPWGVNRQELSPAAGGGRAFSPPGRACRAPCAKEHDRVSSLSPGGGGGHRRPAFGVSSAKNTLGSSLARGHRSVSPVRGQVRKEALSPRKTSPNRAPTKSPAGRVNSPSSLPAVTAGSGEESDCLERTTPPRDSPKRTGVVLMDGDTELGADRSPDVGSQEKRREGVGDGGGLGAEEVKCGGTVKPGTKESYTLRASLLSAGVEESLCDTARLTPMQSPLWSPFARAPSPSVYHGDQDHGPPQGETNERGSREPGTRDSATNPAAQQAPSSGVHHGGEDHAPQGETSGRGGVGRESGPRDSVTKPPAAPQRPPLHDTGRPVKGHAPPGLCYEGAKRASTGSEFEVSAVSVGAETAGQGAGGAFRASTPTGDGGSADLSLWITLRHGDEADGFLSSSPSTHSQVSTVTGRDSEIVPWHAPGNGALMTGREGASLLSVESASCGDRGGVAPLLVRAPRVSNIYDSHSWEGGGVIPSWKAAEGAGNDESLWRALSGAICRILQFCRPCDEERGRR